MTDQQTPVFGSGSDAPSPFEELIGRGSAPEPSSGSPSAGLTFTTAFRGYDKDEVDAALANLTARLRAETEKAATLRDRHERAGEQLHQRARETVERLEKELAAADTERREVVARLEKDLADSQKKHQDLSEKLGGSDAEHRGTIAHLEAELAAANAKVAASEQKIEALTEELSDSSGESDGRRNFEEILRVAEEQASTLIKNATIQADRLLEAARGEITARRSEAHTDAEAIIARAEHDAQQARLRIETELTAHEAQLEREAQHAAEKVSQAEQEAAAIRTESEKGAAALRSLVARETTQQRTEAEEAVKELRMRALEFEESLTRRQDDAQQEFLMLHNQAVAHAERLTQDANEQVAAALEHAQRVATKADDFDRLMRAQAQQIEADAKLRAGEHLDRARSKAKRIIETVTVHSQAVLRDAEDRTRQLRWQQHQLTSFMAEVGELIRAEQKDGLSFDDEAPAADVPVAEEPADEPAAEVAEDVASDAPADDEAAEHEPAEAVADDAEAEAAPWPASGDED